MIFQILRHTHLYPGPYVGGGVKLMWVRVPLTGVMKYYKSKIHALWWEKSLKMTIDLISSHNIWYTLYILYIVYLYKCVYIIVIFAYIHTQESLMFRRPQLHAGVRAASSAAKKPSSTCKGKPKQICRKTTQGLAIWWKSWWYINLFLHMFLMCKKRFLKNIIVWINLLGPPCKNPEVLKFNHSGGNKENHGS